MSKPKHTPGPWAVSNAGPEQALHIYHKSSGDVLAVQPTFNCVRSEANANLMASAPYAIDALERVFEDLYVKKLGGLSFGGRKMLNDAIAKAKGQ